MESNSGHAEIDSLLTQRRLASLEDGVLLVFVCILTPFSRDEELHAGRKRRA
jgi:hypothetical protein